MNSSQILINDVYIPYLSNTKRYLHLWGGSGSGKSVFAAQKVIIRLKTEKPHRILCIRKVANTLRSSVYQLLRDTIDDMGLTAEFTINKSEMRFIHISGNEILLAGLDDVEKLKSIAGITSIWIEEATELLASDFDQLDLRLRGETPHYKQIMFTYNPISERHWLKSRFHDSPLPEFDCLRTTFQDNHFIDAEYRKVLENKAMSDPNLYKIYFKGEWGVENKEGKFCWAFDDSQVKPTTWDNERTTWATFDFNVNPMTCTVVQVLHEIQTVRAIESIKLDNSNVYEMCDRLLASYPDSLWMVTGDASGNSHSAMVKDSLTYYKIIQSQMNLSMQQMQVPTVNPRIEDNKIFVNAVHKNWNVEIDPDKCKPLIYDLQYVEVDFDGKIIKDRSNTKRFSDFLDGWRYVLNIAVKPFFRI